MPRTLQSLQEKRLPGRYEIELVNRLDADDLAELATWAGLTEEMYTPVTLFSNWVKSMASSTIDRRKNPLSEPGHWEMPQMFYTSAPGLADIIFECYALLGLCKRTRVKFFMSQIMRDLHSFAHFYLSKYKTGE